MQRRLFEHFRCSDIGSCNYEYMNTSDMNTFIHHEGSTYMYIHTYNTARLKKRKKKNLNQTFPSVCLSVFFAQIADKNDILTSKI